MAILFLFRLKNTPSYGSKTKATERENPKSCYQPKQVWSSLNSLDDIRAKNLLEHIITQFTEVQESRICGFISGSIIYLLINNIYS